MICKICSILSNPFCLNKVPSDDRIMRETGSWGFLKNFTLVSINLLRNIIGSNVFTYCGSHKLSDVSKKEIQVMWSHLFINSNYMFHACAIIREYF